MPDASSTVVATDIAIGGFKKIAEKLRDNLIQSVGDKLSAIHENFSTDFEPHLNATFERCSLIKTILNRAEPVELLSIYVNTNFRMKDKSFDDYYVIDNVHKVKRINITGLGGGGKTIFMKYLWLSLFNNPEGKVPIFIELRRINDFSSDDLMTYIYRSIIDVKSKISERIFTEAMRSGIFTLLLDGFDEVSQDKKKSIETQILKISHENPKTTIIVSGRPDARFDAWQAFSNFEVLPLEQQQTIRLIEKLNYDAPTKKRFVDRVKKDLYNSHTSFLSSPLLATMMLLTFDQFADIPEKIYIFFEQAFDTLYLRHDATKEGFQRKKYTDLPIDLFKRYFSYFCLITYYDEKIELSETDMLTYADKAFRANQVNVKSQDFIKDVVESICIIQRDGLDYIFTHRSFQEYFTAYCLANFIDESFEEIAGHLVTRRNDNVVSMLLDMQKDKTEAKFIIPALENNLKEAIAANCANSAVDFVKHYGCNVRAQTIGSPSKERDEILMVNSTNGSHEFILSIMKLYPSHFHKEDGFRAFKTKDKRALRAIRKKYFSDTEEMNFVFGKSERKRKDGSKAPTIPLEEIEGTGYASYAVASIEKLKDLLTELKRRNENSKKSIAQILNLKNQ